MTNNEETTIENTMEINNNDMKELIKNLVENSNEHNTINIDNNEITWNDISLIMDDLANKYRITRKDASIATMLLMLKGAANAGTPDTLSVQINSNELNKIIEIKKYELLSSYRGIMGNKFLRRLAEKLGPDICRLAENIKLSGDLAKKINNRVLARGQSPLNNKERAWCNSFMQGSKELETEAPRILNLLAEDFNIKFKITGSERQNNNRPNPTRPKRKGGKRGNKYNR